MMPESVWIAHCAAGPFIIITKLGKRPKMPKVTKKTPKSDQKRRVVT